MDRCRPARRPVGHRNHRETNRETDWERPVGQEMGWGGRAGARIKFRLVDLEHTGSRRSEGGVVTEELLKRPRPVGRPAEEARGLGRSAGRERTGRAGGGGTRTSWSRGWGGSGGGWGSVEGQVVKQNRGGVDRGGRSTKPVGHRSSEPGRLWTWVASPRPDGSRVGGPFCKSRDRPVVGEPVGHRSGSAGRSKPVGPTRAGCEAGGGSARASWSPAGRNRGRSWTWW